MIQMRAWGGGLLAVLLLVLLLAPASAADTPAGAPPWERLQEDVRALAERQLKRASRFADLERDFQWWRLQAAPGSFPENVESSEWEKPSESLLSGLPEDLTEYPRIVSDFVRYFSTRGRNQFQVFLARLDHYRPMIETVFAEEGVPEDLIWVGLVESGFNPLARSPKNAVGIWQLIPGTAARYGLIVGDSRDDRTNPVKSTRAAARYLRFLYNSFGDWALALAAYNAGEQRVAAAVKQTGVRDFWELARMGLLPLETQRYVPAVLAARLLGQPGRETSEFRPASQEQQSGG